MIQRICKTLMIMIIVCVAIACAHDLGQRRVEYVNTPINYSDPNTPLPTVYDIQTLLVAKGKDIGPDGIDGRMKSCDTYDAWVKAICDQHAVNAFERMAKGAK